MRYIVPLLLIVTLSSCAVSLQKQYAILEKKRICCISPEQISYTTLSEKNKIKIDSSSQVYALKGDKSYIYGAVIPPASTASISDSMTERSDTSDLRASNKIDGNRYIYVKSYFNGTMIGQYFNPVFWVLDESYNTIELFSLDLQFNQGNMFSDPNAHMAGYFKLAKKSKYMVILTRDMGDKVPVVYLPPSTSMMMIGNNMVPITTPGVNQQLERSPTGLLSIEITDQKK